MKWARDAHGRFGHANEIVTTKELKGVVMAVVEGPMSLEGSLPVVPRLIEAPPVTVTLQSREIQVSLPRFAPFSQEVNPPLIDPMWTYPESASLREHSQFRVGDSWGEGLRIGLGVWLSAVRLQMSDDVVERLHGARIVPREIMESIRVWRRNLNLWAESVTTYSSGAPKPPLRLNSFDFWSTEGIVQGGTSGWVALERTVEVELITLDQWPLILGAACIGPPSIEWQLIVAGQNLMADGDYRRAVIDLAAAADIALTIIVEREISRCPENFRPYLRDRMTQHGLEALAQALRRLGRQFWDQDDFNTLKHARNAAAHGGTQPDRSAAETSLRVARRIVNRATNIDDHLKMNQPRTLP